MTLQRKMQNKIEERTNLDWSFLEISLSQLTGTIKTKIACLQYLRPFLGILKWDARLMFARRFVASVYAREYDNTPQQTQQLARCCLVGEVVTNTKRNHKTIDNYSNYGMTSVIEPEVKYVEIIIRCASSFVRVSEELDSQANQARGY